MSEEEMEDVPLSSDDNESDEESSKHEELLAKITKLGKKRKLEQREEPSLVVSEFHLSNSKDYQVDTNSLIAALTNKKGVRHLKTRLNKVDNKTAHLLKPLSSVKKDKLQRKVAFEEAKIKVSKWESIVKHNRKAEHLKFPLQAEIPPRPSLSTKVESFEPRTAMELEVAAVLRESQHDLPNDQELTESEKKSLLKLSLEEAKERRAELRKMRTLISAYEQKQRRISRIKSKKFHKVQRKLKAKMESKEISEDTSEERLLKAEKLRAKERATLKHSRMSKWAKDQLVRKHRDPTIRNALTEQSMLKKELKQKQRIQESSSDEGSVVTESEGEDDPTPLISDPSNPWLREDQMESGRTSDKAKKRKEASLVSVNEESNNDSCDEDNNGGKMRATKGAQLYHGVIDTQNYMKSSDIRKSKLAQASENLLAVQEAFAGDDVINEFLQDKQEDIEDDKPKAIDTSLPGWGSWAGLGVDQKKKQREKKMEVDKDKDEVNDRMDSHLKYVIINHKRDKKVAKHMVSNLPYPLTDGIQFKKMMAAPVGRHWNTETRFTDMIRPRVQTSIGSLIQPMRMTDEVHKFMQKTSKDKKKHFNNKRTKS